MENKKDRKITAWFFVLVFSLVPLLTQAQEEISPGMEEDPSMEYIHDYLVTAAENNPELKALFNRYLAALEEVKQEGVLPDPQLSFGYFILPVETRVGEQKANASFSQMFPWFGTLDAKQRVAAERARIALHLFNVAKAELYRDIRITYNELYYLEKAIAITEENLKLLESFKGIAEVTFESGKAGFSSVLQVQIEEEELQSELEFLLDSRLPLLTEFEQLLNTDLEEPVDLPDSLWEEQLLLEKSEIYEEILATSPHIVHMRHEAQVHEYEAEVAEKMGMPSFTLGTSYTYISPRTNLESGMAIPDNGQDVFMFPQLGIRLPIYRKKYKAMKKEALLRQEAVGFEIENLENELLTEMEQRYRDYLEAQRKVELYTRLTTLAEQSLRLLQTELATGQNDLFEIIRMERRLLNYRLELAKARTEKNNNVYRIHYLMGEQHEQDR
ncbi:TolC family protein [Nafulsella turpanensis]|uniref:TolC family protein n=1 Tax=Nafulsella turpanensis TaxID=1265690 RepID=UPI00034BDAC2|nr:TolC family protein [Nafulsella turpanensis]